MKLLVDGVFFQLADSGINRIWRSVLPLLTAGGACEVFVLDRGGLPAIEGIKRIPFPAYKDLYTADDSSLIQKVCDFYQIDVFTSTYYTTPLTTPMFLLVYDMIPEIFGFDLAHRHWKEKAIAISYARQHICISRNTRDDLLARYPSLDRVSVAYPACDRTVFRPVGEGEVAAFRRSVGLDHRPYVMTVGSREQHLDYKNGRLLFDAIAGLNIEDFDILCIGGEPSIAPRTDTALPAKVTARRIEASDAELAAAYSGAAGLIYPSLYEGFGLPVLEAMSCGCPVVTTALGSLGEVAGDACLTIGGSSWPELATALRLLRDGPERKRLRDAGLRRAETFDWSDLVQAMGDAIAAMARLANEPDYRCFAATWSALRLMQRDVDVDLWRQG